MARAVQKTAAKDYPANGIKKGDKYWFASVKTGPRSSLTIRSINPIPRSRLTSSEFLSALYDHEDSIEKIAHEEGMAEVLESLAQDIRELGSEQQDKFDNLPEGFQQGETGQTIEERANNCEAWADEIEQAADTLRDALTEIAEKTAEDFDELDDDADEDEIEAAREAARSVAYEAAIDSVNENNPF